MSDQQKRTVPKRITEIHSKWTHQVKILQGLQYVLVVAAVVSSVLAGGGIGKNWLWVGADTNLLSLIAAMAIGLVSAFELGAKANNFRNAWRTLNAAIMRYEEDSNYTEEQLISEYEKAEKLIGETKASPRPG